MKAQALGRHLPLLIWATCTALLTWFVERQHYLPNTSLAFEIFGATFLGVAIMRNYTGPRFMNSALPRFAGVVVSIALALAAAFLLAVVIIRIRQ